MRLIATLGLLALLASACSTGSSAMDDYTKTTVEFNNESHVIYYKVRIQSSSVNENIFFYTLKDEATKSDDVGGFQVLVSFKKVKEDSSLYGIQVSYWNDYTVWDMGEIQKDSVLQNIVLNNPRYTASSWEVIFFNFLEQIRKQNPDLP